MRTRANVSVFRYDTVLLAFAFVALTFEILFLLHQLRFLHLPGLSTEVGRADVVGVVQTAERSVQTRRSDSLSWFPTAS
ncbi:hypothetical protein K2X33_14120, partial [bacterium]|nr:hypothetical protein [bacterium]